MNDRIVRKVSPTPESGEAGKPFSTYLDYPNLVLIGDPGAGKSHLFRQFAPTEHADQFTARDFLNVDVSTLTTNSVLYVDALDEKRAGRGDQNTVDEIIRKLSVIKPQKVRIACRAVDWLGETDLAAFQAYFNRTGETGVVSLEPLSEAEQVDVLTAKGHPHPSKFLEEARSRGLDELLSNPQNLTMLADVVRKRDWPSNRTGLYKESVDILLSEHNLSHSRRGSGSYTSEELLDAAGAVCAVRLISDIDGICLIDTSPHESFPSYRNITLSDRGRLQAALGRRAFEAGRVPETVDYTHRTVAEYLAAFWLANRIRAGLPVGRVRALLGVNGRPASELRGLHAWLAVFLPEHSEILIDADPFGVLSYGDASSLTPSLRKHLLEALAKLAEVDPWFRAGNWSSTAVASLSGVDMEESFRVVLTSKQASFTLRSVVLDALAAGLPIPALRPVILEILVDSRAPYAERETSIRAILRMGDDGRAVLGANPCGTGH